MAQILRYRETIPNANLTELKALDVKFRNHQKVTVAAYTTSTNIRVKVKYIFEPKETHNMASTGGSVQAISGTTAANPVVFTSTSHGYNVGDIVRIEGSSVQAYNVEGTISAKDANTFTLGQVDTSAASSFSGTATSQYRGSEVDIQTVDLTSGTLSLLSFDMKLGFIRITRDDTGSNAGGGVLYIDATVAK